ncbi:MAG: hypothetical protein Ct9H300mP28_03640 [Pseudomonadota bacterium]|nr:MAG: hypothetical protein Ct9H300mP28_03640 [Pseudomonadota bacterium]
MVDTLLGEARDSHNEDFMMLKVDQNGNKQWWKKFSDKPDNSAYDAIEALMETSI